MRKIPFPSSFRTISHGWGGNTLTSLKEIVYVQHVPVVQGNCILSLKASAAYANLPSASHVYPSIRFRNCVHVGPSHSVLSPCLPANSLPSRPSSFISFSAQLALIFSFHSRLDHTPLYPHRPRTYSSYYYHPPAPAWTITKWTSGLICLVVVYLWA